MARLAIPEDDTEDNRERRAAAASESGTPLGELDESDLIACVDWSMKISHDARGWWPRAQLYPINFLLGL